MPLSHAHGPSDMPLVDETIGAYLARIVERFPDREALVVRHQDYRATYQQLWEQVDAAARGLLARGVRKGDRVGIWSPNRHEWVVVQYATARVGAILVNINPAYLGPELEYVLNQAGVGVLIHSSGYRQADYRAMVAAARPRCRDLRHVLHLEADWAGLLARG